MNVTSDSKCTAIFLLISLETITLRKAFIGAYNLGKDLFECYQQARAKTCLGDLDRIQKDLENLAKYQINYLNYSDLAYPKALKQIADPPLVIFFMGRIEAYDFTIPSWAIVGARKASPQGINLAKKIALLLAGRQQKIISGLAIGIDTAAHQGALDSEETAATLAVLGNGLPGIYPVCNQKLAERIVQSGGLVCSQFYPFSPAYPANFLNRNRLIAGLAENVLVVEASEQSGSRVTARYALEQGKNIYVIPGDIFNKNYLGSNQLIKQGAEIVTRIEDFDELVPSLQCVDRLSGLTADQKILYQEISNYTQISLSELKIKTLEQGISLEAFYQQLIILENIGKIKTLPGDFVQVY